MRSSLTRSVTQEKSTADYKHAIPYIIKTEKVRSIEIILKDDFGCFDVIFDYLDPDFLYFLFVICNLKNLLLKFTLK